MENNRPELSDDEKDSELQDLKKRIIIIGWKETIQIIGWWKRFRITECKEKDHNHWMERNRLKPLDGGKDSVLQDGEKQIIIMGCKETDQNHRMVELIQNYMMEK